MPWGEDSVGKGELETWDDCKLFVPKSEGEKENPAGRTYV